MLLGQRWLSRTPRKASSCLGCWLIMVIGAISDQAEVQDHFAVYLRRYGMRRRGHESVARLSEWPVGDTIRR